MKNLGTVAFTCVKTSVSNGGLGMCQPNDFYLI